MAAIQVDLNKRPPSLGLTGSGGVPKNHVGFKDGIGSSQNFLTLDLCSSLEVSLSREPISNFAHNPSKRLQEYLKIMFADSPGKKRIDCGHYKLFCETNSHAPRELTKENWLYLVDPGCSIFLAFVVGTWQMNCITFCPLCGSKNSGDWRTWLKCDCDLSYIVSEAGEVEYEPQDGFWRGEHTEIPPWKPSSSRKQKGNGSKPSNSTVNNVIDPMEVPEDTDIENSTRKPNEELYFKTIVLVYDPIWNFVCRNVFCRCILGATCFTSNAPRIDILSSHACPRHKRSGVRSLVKSITQNHEEDPYFSKFGGYQNFRKIARFLNDGTIALAFLDAENLCPATAIDVLEIFSLMETHSEAVLEYRSEVLSKLEYHWEESMKAECESVKPDCVQRVQEWISEERSYLAVNSSNEEKPEQYDASFQTLKDLEDPVMPCLSKRSGRMTMEKLSVFMDNDDYLYAPL